MHAAQGPHGAAQPSAPERPQPPSLIAKAGPGAALGSWAEGPAGREAVEKVYERSGSLNGDAVVIFARALAAVGQEELVPVRPGEAPRCADQCRPAVENQGVHYGLRVQGFAPWASNDQKQASQGRKLSGRQLLKPSKVSRKGDRL